jgi:hypothetical protein
MSAVYDAYRNFGLLGGVWPGVTWWYAMAAARYHPDFMAKALRTSFEHYARDPKRYNTVPGQFSEWFDGESLVNRGMRLSPWEPPRFVESAIQGICGINLRAGPLSSTLTCTPRLPPEWKWVGLRRLLYRGRELSYFAVRTPEGSHIYATNEYPVETAQATQQLYDKDVSTSVTTNDPLVQHVAFQKPGEVLVCLGSCAAQTILCPLRLGRLLERDAEYRVEIYHSEWNRWVPGERVLGADLERTGVQIEAGGYRLLRFQQKEV